MRLSGELDLQCLPVLRATLRNPDELPLTPVIKTQHAQNLVWGLARGEPNRERIALTMSRVMASELTSSASPAGLVERWHSASSP